PAAVGSTTRGAGGGVRVPSSGRRARPTGRARTGGRRQRRRTTQAQAASNHGSADATRLRAQRTSGTGPCLTTEFVHPTGIFRSCGGDRTPLLRRLSARCLDLAVVLCARWLHRAQIGCEAQHDLVFARARETERGAVLPGIAGPYRAGAR